MQLEGIMGKDGESAYVSRRSRDWVKIKTGKRQEFVIGGFTAPRASREKFGALLVGVYDDKKQLIYAGKVGGGFNAKQLLEIHKKLTPLIQKKCPFTQEIKGATWVKPVLVCEVSFAEWTQDNRMRHPIFHSLKSNPKSNGLTNPDKIYWPDEKYTKGDLIEY